jgi:hypothetical protein
VLHAFDSGGARRRRRPRTRSATDGTGREPARRYHCAACITRVTDEDAALEIDGAHRHAFVNPAGVSFAIGCFAVANCRVDGEPTLEATWFPGCAWSYALCANCSAHLGWRYDGARGFWGLIFARLVGPA